LNAKVQSVQQAQRQSLERFKMLKPEGRISLNITPSTFGNLRKLPFNCDLKVAIDTHSTPP
jgi:hypothetical protein